MNFIIMLLGWIAFVIGCLFVLKYILDIIYYGIKSFDFTVCYIWCCIKLEKHETKYIPGYIKMFFINWWDFYHKMPWEIYGENWCWEPGFKAKCFLNEKYYFFNPFKKIFVSNII